LSKNIIFTKKCQFFNQIFHNRIEISPEILDVSQRHAGRLTHIGHLVMRPPNPSQGKHRKRTSTTKNQALTLKLFGSEKKRLRKSLEENLWHKQRKRSSYRRQRECRLKPTVAEISGILGEFFSSWLVQCSEKTFRTDPR